MHRRRQIKSWLQTRLHGQIGLMLMLAVPTAIAAGCGDQRDVVDRVETLALAKSMFNGEWYYQQTVVEVPGTRTVTMEGNTNYQGMYRVRWDIQKDYLYARKAYQVIDGAKGENEDTGAFQGAIVGAWKIVDHFDVKRGYNPRTGEEDNVLGENAEDCDWYDCRFIRVNWQTNEATDYNFYWQASIDKEAVPFFHEDRSDPKFTPIFDGKQGYIDFVTAMAIKPKAFDFFGNKYPICWFVFGSNAECNTEIVHVRNSFMRRHPNRDYEPREHVGAITEWFGFFDNQRHTWDRQTGLHALAQKKMINRHNLWTKHHYEDAACTSNKECTDKHGPASRCDTYLPFHANDIATDTDADSLPDSFEQVVGLNPHSADSDGDGIVDQSDDSVNETTSGGNGKPDLYDFQQWAAANTHYRCTIPLAKREQPVPLAYFDTGNFPRDMACDKNAPGGQAVVEDDGSCKDVWKFSADKKVQTQQWSVLHQISEDYNATFWKTFLLGAYGCSDPPNPNQDVPGCWTLADYEKWIANRNADEFAGPKREVLDRFGSPDHGYYAYVVCPNNPVRASDPWPCRFPQKTYVDAKALIDQGKDTPDNWPKVRPGDVRYSQIHFAKDYYDGHRLLGLGPSHTDPRTGENLAGVANVYVLNDWAATRIQEMVQLLNGTLKPEDFVDGANLKFWTNYLNQQNAKGMQQRQVSQAQIAAIYQSMKQPWMNRINKLGDAADFAKMNHNGKRINQSQLKKILMSEVADSGLFDPARTPINLRMLRGTDLEQQMVSDPDVLAATGLPPDLLNAHQKGQLPDEILNRASVARGGFLDNSHVQEELKLQMADRMNAYFVDMADTAMLGLAHRLKDQPPEKVWSIAREIIMRAVLTHEIGHTVGLHHNWGGSEDAMNFPKEFWQLRTNDFTETKPCDPNNPGKDQLCPFFVKPFTEYQLGRDAKNAQQGLKGIYEYAYTSIMDYSGRYTLDGNGLGRYDRAAILYGHADKVEVFKDPGGFLNGTNPRGAVNMFREYHEGDGSPLVLFNSGPESRHYTTWFTGIEAAGEMRRGMGENVYKEENRRLVDYRSVRPFCHHSRTDSVAPCDSFKPEDEEQLRDIGNFAQSGDTFSPRVPYVFCSYTRGNIGDGCRTRDYGADQWERMDMFIDDMNTWYPMRSFTRYQVGSSQNGYIRSWIGRYREIKDFNNLYALYQGLFRQWYQQGQIDTFFSNPIKGWGAYTVAMHDSFNFALRTLAMPDVKSFNDKATQPDGEQLYTEGTFGSAFRTNMSNGRYFSTSWRNTDFEDECGLEFYKCLHRFGFYYDKIMALWWLTNPTTYFVGRDTSEDIRQYRISFFDNFQTQLVDFFGAVLSEDYKAYAPWFDPSPAKKDKTFISQHNNGGGPFDVEWINGIAYRNYVDKSLDPPQPPNGAPVEPATRFTLQVYMAVFGMIQMQQNFDQDFSERGLMWKEGPGQGITVKPTDKVSGITSFVDPFTGTTYQGAAYKDGRGIAQRMIAHANTLKSRSGHCNKTPGEADSCSIPFVDTRAEGELYEYRQLMDVMVKLSQVFIANWSWNPFDPG